MSRDAAIESWLASMSESELIAQCFFWHDMALEHGRMYNAVNADNAKLRELARDMYEMAYPERPSAFEAAFADRMRELGVEAGDA